MPWLYFHAAIITLLAVEYLLHLAVPNTRRKAVYATILWTTAAFALAAILIPHYKVEGATQYLAGYAIEQTLSVDNLFVFLLLFGLFRIAPHKQPKVLFWGVAGAIVMRGLFIFAGVSLLERFHWIGYVFAALILVAAVRLLRPESPTDAAKPPAWLAWLTRLQPVSANQNHFFVREIPAAHSDGLITMGVAPGPDFRSRETAATNSSESGKPRLMITVLFLALVAVELTDVVFALDSIPAVLSITRQPFLAYTSNIMAVMGLRSLYVLLASALSKLRYLHFGLAAVLAFAAVKMLLADWLTITPLASIAVIVALLGITIAISLVIPKTNS
jgi:tellurite resistance protein TerC